MSLRRNEEEERMIEDMIFSGGHPHEQDHPEEANPANPDVDQYLCFSPDAPAGANQPHGAPDAPEGASEPNEETGDDEEEVNKITL